MSVVADTPVLIAGVYRTDYSTMDMDALWETTLIYGLAAVAVFFVGLALIRGFMWVRGFREASGASYERSLQYLIGGCMAIFLSGYIGMVDIASGGSSLSLQSVGYGIAAVGLALAVVATLLPLFWKKR